MSAAGPLVDFYFGLGSRYSYLASTQLGAISARTGARFRWRAAYSPDLFAAAGFAPFAEQGVSGQYSPAYRTRDVERWAALYGVPFRDPHLDGAHYRRLTHAVVASDDRAEPFAKLLWDACFAHNDPPTDGTSLNALAAKAGITRLDMTNVETKASAIIAEAVAAGVFGVPSFVNGGEVFFGNDRLGLLEHHLTRVAA